MNVLSHGDITVLLVSLAVLLGTARLFGEIAQRFHQPAVLGEILAGIILGQTILGTFWPEFHSYLFPAQGPVAISLNALTTVAITLFLLVAGMEVDLSMVWRQGRAALIVGSIGIVFPFAIGFLPAWFYPELLGGDADSNLLVFSLFLATAMSITALPVIAKILMDLNLFRTEVGVTVVAAAIMNDLIGWIIFALVLVLMEGQGMGSSVGFTILLTLLFAFLMLTAGRWLIDRVLPWIQAHTGWPGGVLGFALTMAFLCAAFTEAIGVHAIFGAFLFGVALGDSPRLRQRTRTTIDNFVSFVFAPLFFASIGLHVDFVSNFDLQLTLIILFLATVGKVGGCYFAARISGYPPKESKAIGFGMNARGAMEIILGLLALNYGIINDQLFVALVVMALVTSVTSAALIQRVYHRTKSIRFTDYVSAKTFVQNLDESNRFDIIKSLATKALDALQQASEAPVIDLEQAIANVIRREQLISSAIGNGVAVPNAYVAGLKQPLVAIGLSQAGIDFDSPDGQLVSVIILVLTPLDGSEQYLNIVADVTQKFHAGYVSRAASKQSRNLTEFLAVLNVESAKARSH